MKSFKNRARILKHIKYTNQLLCLGNNLSLLIVNLDYCDNDITILRKTYVSRGVK